MLLGTKVQSVESPADPSENNNFERAHLHTAHKPAVGSERAGVLHARHLRVPGRNGRTRTLNSCGGLDFAEPTEQSY